MKVHVKKVSRKLNKDEMRVINVPFDAIVELLQENLTENAAEYFDVKKVDETRICEMQWDTEHNTLTYVVMPIHYAYEKRKLNYDFVREQVGITTTSLFRAYPKRYKRLIITEEIFEKEL